MRHGEREIYREMAERTGGDVYIGVVGPVRTGKSTFVKRVMETMVIPNIENIYRKERAKDELPQSGSGKTIMTSEPKFVPEEAVSVSPDGRSRLSIRMIDSVGYMIPGAVGAEEDGKPRMVTTPWYPQEIPMTEAAELGTKKIMDEHCSIGIVLTTDGTITDIPREDYAEAEDRAIRDMQATGKPYLVLINSRDPGGEAACELERSIDERYGICAICLNCLTMQEEDVREILTGILKGFPVDMVELHLPGWLNALPMENGLKSCIYDGLRKCTEGSQTICSMEQRLKKLQELEPVEQVRIEGICLGTGIIRCEIALPQVLFYKTLSENTGFAVQDDYDLLQLLKELAEVKQAYDKVSQALEQVQATGYGIVMPDREEMDLEAPQMVRKGGNYGVRMKAKAPSIHMLRVDVESEIQPMVGDQKQSEDLLQYLLKEYEEDKQKMWESNIFGKTVGVLVNEGLSAKLNKMPGEVGCKLQSTLTRIVNEGAGGLICIILS